MKYVRSISRGVKKTDEATVSQTFSGSNIAMNSNWALCGCPKCHGDLYLEVDEDGDTFGHCLQCGFTGIANLIQAAG